MKALGLRSWLSKLCQQLTLCPLEKPLQLKFSRTSGWIAIEDKRKPAHGEIVLVFVVDIIDQTTSYSLGHFCCVKGWVLQERCLRSEIPYFWKRLPDMPEIE